MGYKITLELVQPTLVRINQWIEENKHKYRNGITSLMKLSQCIPVSWQHPERGFYPANMVYTQPDYGHCCQKLCRLKRHGYLLITPDTIGGKPTVKVNPKYLPGGSGDYTGVKNPIPMVEPKVAPPKSIQLQAPTPTPTPELTQEAVEEFIKSEMQNIKVQKCTIGSGSNGGRSPFINEHGVMELEDITVWDIYQIGLAMNKTIGTSWAVEDIEEEEDEETPDTEQQHDLQSEVSEVETEPEIAQSEPPVLFSSDSEDKPF